MKKFGFLLILVTVGSLFSACSSLNKGNQPQTQEVTLPPIKNVADQNGSFQGGVTSQPGNRNIGSSQTDNQNQTTDNDMDNGAGPSGGSYAYNPPATSEPVISSNLQPTPSYPINPQAYNSQSTGTNVYVQIYIRCLQPFYAYPGPCPRPYSYPTWNTAPLFHGVVISPLFHGVQLQSNVPYNYSNSIPQQFIPGVYTQYHGVVNNGYCNCY